MNIEVECYGVETIKKYKVKRKIPLIGAKIVNVQFVNKRYINLPYSSDLIQTLNTKMDEQMRKYIELSSGQYNTTLTKYKLFLEYRELLSNLKKNKKRYHRAGIVISKNISYNNIDEISLSDLSQLIEAIKTFEIQESYLMSRSLTANDTNIDSNRENVMQFVKNLK